MTNLRVPGKPKSSVRSDCATKRILKAQGAAPENPRRRHLKVAATWQRFLKARGTNWRKTPHAKAASGAPGNTRECADLKIAHYTWQEIRRGCRSTGTCGGIF